MLFFSLVGSKCTHVIQVEVGARFHQQRLDEDDTICINGSLYPYYLAFYDTPSSIEYHEYYSRYHESLFNNEIHVDQNETIRGFELPYASSYFVSHANDTFVSFAIFSFPGICTTGVYFSNRAKEELSFDKSNEFLTLNNYDDKCVIFIGPGLASYSIDMSSKDHLNQFYFYEDPDVYYVKNGNFIFEKGSMNRNKNIPILRIVTGKTTPPSLLLLSVNSASDPPSKERFGYYLPRHKTVECQEYHDPRNIVITMLVLGSVSLLMIIAMIPFKCNRNK